MKKMLALILAMATCFTLVACGGKPAGDSVSAEQKENSGSASTEEEKPDFASFKLEDWKAYAEELAASGEDDGYNILYLAPANSEYYIVTSKFWKAQFEKYGWTMEYMASSTGDEGQMSLMETALASGDYDLIFYQPQDGSAYEVRYDEWWETYHTPIICWGGYVEGDNCGTYHAQPANIFTYLGDLYYESITAYVDEHWDYFEDIANNGGIPVVATGLAGTIWNDRVLRALELLEADGRFNIVAHYENVPAQEVPNYGDIIARDHPDVEIIVNFCDEWMMLLQPALLASGVEFSEYMGMWGTDGTSAVAKAMMEGAPYIKGSCLPDNIIAAGVIAECASMAIPAAREGIVIEGLTEYNLDNFINSPNHIKLTPDNVADYYNDYWIWE